MSEGIQTGRDLTFIHSQTNQVIASHTNPDDEYRRLALRHGLQPAALRRRYKCRKCHTFSFISILENIMKSIISTFAAAATIATIALASAGAQASDGTITFTGSVTDTTCSIDAKADGSAKKDVTLPTVTNSTLGSIGATAGATAATDLTFALSGCSTETKAVARFENGPTINQTTGYLENMAPDGAQNVQVRLLNAKHAPINVVTGENNKLDDNGVAIVSGAAELKYFAEYYATGKATAGPVKSSVEYTVDYQ
jgi:major type 1 subunit fimbrin (pilin)